MTSLVLNNRALVAKLGGYITAHLLSAQVVVRFKTKQDPIWSKALTVPLTIVLQAVILRENGHLLPRNYFDNRISRQQLLATYLFNR